MKRYLLLLVLTSSHLISYSQESVKIKELGFTTSNLNDFGITYRQGSTNTLWRFNAIASNAGFSNSKGDYEERSNSGFSIGLQVGKEWRKLISQKFELRLGTDLGFRYGQSKYERFDAPSQTLEYKSSNETFKASALGVFGFNFVFTDMFLVGAEFLPALTYSKGSTEQYYQSSGETVNSENESFNFGFSTDSIRLSLLYRF